MKTTKNLEPAVLLDKYELFAELAHRFRLIEGILVNLGFAKSGRCWSSPSVIYTIEVVGSTLALAPGGVGADVSVAHGPVSGKPFTLLSATMMWCDRAMAWEALLHSERDSQHTLLAIKNFPEKIDVKRAQTVLKAAGVLQILHKRVSSLPVWKGFEGVFLES